jgi:hypothetical protein
MTAVRVAPTSQAAGANMTPEQQHAWRAQQVALARAQALAARGGPSPSVVTASAASPSPMQRDALMTKAQQMVPLSSVASVGGAPIPLTSQAYGSSSQRSLGPSNSLPSPSSSLPRSSTSGTLFPQSLASPPPASPSSLENGQSFFGGAPRMSMSRSGRLAAVPQQSAQQPLRR